MFVPFLNPACNCLPSRKISLLGSHRLYCQPSAQATRSHQRVYTHRSRVPLVYCRLVGCPVLGPLSIASLNARGAAICLVLRQGAASSLACMYLPRILGPMVVSLNTIMLIAIMTIIVVISASSSMSWRQFVGPHTRSVVGASVSRPTNCGKRQKRKIVRRSTDNKGQLRTHHHTTHIHKSYNSTQPSHNKIIQKQNILKLLLHHHQHHHLQQRYHHHHRHQRRRRYHYHHQTNIDITIITIIAFLMSMMTINKLASIGWPQKQRKRTQCRQ